MEIQTNAINKRRKYGKVKFMEKRKKKEKFYMYMYSAGNEKENMVNFGKFTIFYVKNGKIT